MGRLMPVLLILAISPSGCLATQNRVVSREGDERVIERTRKLENVEFTTPWRRVYIGDLPEPEFCGYVEIRTERREGTVFTTSYVYDPDFHLVGFFTERGGTFAIPEKAPRFGREEVPGDRGEFKERRIEEVVIGAQRPEDSLRAIFRKRGSVYLRKLPTIEAGEEKS